MKLLHIDTEKDKFEMEIKLLDDQKKQLKIETYPEPQLPKYLLPISITLLSFTSAMIGVFHSIYEIEWIITMVTAIILYGLAFIFLGYSLWKYSKYDREKKEKYDKLFP